MPKNLGSPYPRKSRLAQKKPVFKIVGREYLPRPSDPSGIDFFSVVAQRRSRRDFASLSKELLSKLLWYSAHPYSVHKDDLGYEVQFRPAPSAGGLHPIEFLVICPISAGWIPHIYDPKAHCLCRVEMDLPILNDFIMEIEEVLRKARAHQLFQEDRGIGKGLQQLEPYVQLQRQHLAKQDYLLDDTLIESF